MLNCFIFYTFQPLKFMPESSVAKSLRFIGPFSTENDEPQQQPQQQTGITFIIRKKIKKGTPLLFKLRV
jgi:hypothetical protein